jgi:putative tricarboxylic transport membrane protein
LFLFGGMSLIAILQEGFFSRGLLAGVFGLSIGLIGVSDLGVFRGTFGSVYLFDGVPAIPGIDWNVCGLRAFQLNQ